MFDPLLSSDDDFPDDDLGIYELPKTHGLLPAAGEALRAVVVMATLPVHGALWVRSMITGET